LPPRKFVVRICGDPGNAALAMTPPFGVLLMAYGSPATLRDVKAYYTHIRGGRTPPAEQVAELRARYERIGGRSPLLEITWRQAAGVVQALGQAGLPARAYVGMKHAPPFIAEAVAQAAGDGVRALLALALAPHYSRMSVGAYRAAAEEAAARHGLTLSCIESWHLHPGLISALASRVREAQRQCAGDTDVPVIFTAHSLPVRILEWNDPYPEQLQQTCVQVAAAAKVRAWRFAYQSASATGEPWLGPDLLDVARAIHREGQTECIVCPIGFVADHLEVLYDIDVEAKELAATLGLRLIRTCSLNDDLDFISAVADVIRAHLPQGALA